jgi:DNA modification methylase
LRRKPFQNRQLRRAFDHWNERDCVNTPDDLAKGIVRHFLPQISGRVLEPCEGGGAFTRAFAHHGIKDFLSLEISRGLDFFAFHQSVGWIITNPPWSLARQFLKHAYEIADNVVFLIPLNHVVGLRVRIADMEQSGFGIKEILLCPTPPPPWASSGFQLAAIHLKRGYCGSITWGWLHDQGAVTDTEQESAALAISANAHVLRASAFAIPLKDNSVQMVVTSPPYYLLRKYPGGTDNDLGREKTVELYVEHLVNAMREVRRVLKDDGVVFLNIGDTYHGSGRGAGKNGTNDMKMNPNCSGTPLRGRGKAKSLCLIPHRVPIALENDGWIVRNDIIWEKPNAVPESVKDRCTSSHEFVFVLTKSENYYWDQEAVREPSVCWAKGSLGGGHTASKKDGKMKAWTMRHGNKVGSSKTEKLSPPIGNAKHQALGKPTLVGHRTPMRPTRQLRDVWTINTHPHKEKHIAMFPEALVERCVQLGSRLGDVVLDCFAGSGTTGVVAKKLGRNAVLLDISEEYVRMMHDRISGAVVASAARASVEKAPVRAAPRSQQTPRPTRFIPTLFQTCQRSRMKHRAAAEG